MHNTKSKGLHAKRKEGKAEENYREQKEGQDEHSDKEICMQNWKLITEDFLNGREKSSARDNVKSKKFNEIMKKDKFSYKASNY